LIELLVVMAVIAILVAILLPAIQAIRTNVQNGRVIAEIRAMDAALNDFKAEFGSYPPSRITLYEAATGPTSWAAHTDVVATPLLDEDQERIRSRGIIRGLWPNFDFAKPRNMNPSVDSDETDVYVLTGAECLAFFLGGILSNSGTPDGFSKNAADPFSAPAVGETRTGPFFEFNGSRLVDVDIDDLDGDGNDDDGIPGDGVNEYVDTLPDQTTPYVYVTSYKGKGYEVGDTSITTDNSVDLRVFADFNRNLNDIYRQGAGNTATPWKNRTYQIISPGYDTFYGNGGEFTAEGSDALSESERDNLTNFHTGMLAR
jgi:type II secretory pathway pseudopilin PulG